MYWEVPRTTPRGPFFSANHTAASGWILENHCSARLFDGVEAIIGVVCGSDNRMFGTKHSPDRMTRSATSTNVGQGAQSDESDPSNVHHNRRAKA